jgi:hypothetical protein
MTQPNLLIANEQPPASTSPELSEWLSRKLRETNAALSNNRILDVSNSLVLFGFSLADQNPAGTDTPLQIEFGPASGTASDPVTKDALGKLYFNESGDYDIRIVLNCIRTTSGTSTIFIMYGMVNGVVAGLSGGVELDSQRETAQIRLTIPLTVNSGDTATLWFLKDSTGNANGLLRAFIPTLAGIPPLPSSFLQVIKRKTS